MISAQFIFTYIDFDLPHLLYTSLVSIKRLFVLGLVDLFGVDHLVTKERNGVEVFAESESPNADRVNLIGYGYVFQFFAIVECVVANSGDRRG